MRTSMRRSSAGSVNVATDRAIAGILAMLHELFPTRDIGERTLDAFALVFADWSDEELQTCAAACARESGRTFFPTPGEIAAHRQLPPIDVERLLAQISKLGSHDPRKGWIYPSPEQIRDAFGSPIADAYLAAGGARCFAQEASDGSSITRDIARREFGEQLATVQRRHPDRPLLPPSVPALRLSA